MTTVFTFYLHKVLVRSMKLRLSFPLWRRCQRGFRPPRLPPGLFVASRIAEALLDFDLKKHRMSMNVNIVIDDPEELERVRQKEMDITKEPVSKRFAALKRLKRGLKEALKRLKEALKALFLCGGEDPEDPRCRRERHLHHERHRRLRHEVPRRGFRESSGSAFGL